MYRSDEWADGFYIDNHRKYECMCCEKQFIVGEELLNGKEPKCPYCGSTQTELQSWTDDNELEELDSDMGCLAIRVYKEESN